MNLRDVTLGQLADALGGSGAAGAAAWTDLSAPESPVPHRMALEAGRRGELTVHRVGRRRLVRTEELDAWIERQPTLAEPRPSTTAPTKSAAALVLERNGWRATG